MSVKFELPLMIELQRIWDIIMKARDNISRSDKSIAYWNRRIEELKQGINNIENKLKDLNVSTKTKETSLQDLGSKLKKLDETRNVLKNEKELNALASQIDSVKEEYDQLENSILEELETIEEYQAELQGMSDELASLEKTVAVDIEKLEESKAEQKEILAKSQAEFDEHAEKLSPAIKAKFMKMLQSSGGRALVPLEGDVCSACHFKQPPSILSDISAGNALQSCVSCSRFLYKKE